MSLKLYLYLNTAFTIAIENNLQMLVFDADGFSVECSGKSSWKYASSKRRIKSEMGQI